MNELQNIVAKWRETWGSPIYTGDEQRTYSRCADEIEATLPAAGGGVEAVAKADEAWYCTEDDGETLGMAFFATNPDYVKQHPQCNWQSVPDFVLRAGSRAFGVGNPTPPSPPVAEAVDEAAVERALIAGFAAHLRDYPMGGESWADYCKDAEPENIDAWREWSRVALLAALRPGAGA